MCNVSIALSDQTKDANSRSNCFNVWASRHRESLRFSSGRASTGKELKIAFSLVDIVFRCLIAQLVRECECFYLKARFDMRNKLHEPGLCARSPDSASRMLTLLA